MKKPHVISALLSVTGICLIVIGLIIIGVTDQDSFVAYTSNNQLITNSMTYTSSKSIEELNMTASPKSTLEIARAYQGDITTGLTVDEIATQLNKYLGKDLLMNKGELIASYSISLGVDPYIATAIMLHETGCASKCSNLARICNNVAGQKGSPACSGSYKGYDTIDDGIRGAIDNLYKNYYSKGLTTVEQIGPKYAEGTTWVGKISSFVKKLKSE